MFHFKILALFLLIFVNLKGQNSVFSIKPCLGVSACQIHGDNYTGYDKLGFVGGVYVNAKLKKKISLEFGLLFIQKGAAHYQNPEKFDYTYYYLNLNYLELPLIFRYALNIFFLTAGPSFGYLIDYYEGNELGNNTGTYPFKSFEYSFNVGLGMQFAKNFSVELRTNNSFVTIRPFPNNFKPYYNNFIATYFNNGYYSNILTLTLYYKINPKTKSGNQPKT